MTQVQKGSCHCGSVAFEVRDGAGIVACHCQDCQKMHGNFFAVLVADQDKVTYLKDDTVTWYRSSDAVQRSFCSTCGSRLFKKPDEGQKIMISAGLLGRETGLKITKNIFTESKPDWYELPPTVAE
ncbi:MAG: GFA family protein [Candidatus Sericytochromatia bacterium]